MSVSGDCPPFAAGDLVRSSRCWFDFMSAGPLLFPSWPPYLDKNVWRRLGQGTGLVLACRLAPTEIDRGGEWGVRLLTSDGHDAWCLAAFLEAA